MSNRIKKKKRNTATTLEPKWFQKHVPSQTTHLIICYTVSINPLPQTQWRRVLREPISRSQICSDTPPRDISSPCQIDSKLKTLVWLQNYQDESISPCISST